MANRTCDQCGGAMPHRMSRQRNEKGHLVCDNCKQWPAKVTGMTDRQKREFAKRAAEAVTSIMRVGADRYTDGSSTDWRVRETAGGVTYTLVSNGYMASVWGSRMSGDYEWEVLDPQGQRIAGASDPVDVNLALDSAEQALPGLAVAASRRIVAHDSGDNAVLNHCPFCGSGAITGGSDGSVECDYCHTVFTVQVQPAHPNMPQTIDGAPTPPPGMPAGQMTEMSAPVDPAVDEDASGAPSDPFGDAKADPTEQSGQHDPSADQDVDKGNPFAKKPDGDNKPPSFKKGSMFFTEEGDVLSHDGYIKRLALDFSDDRMATLAAVRNSNLRVAVKTTVGQDSKVRLAEAITTADGENFEVGKVLGRIIKDSLGAGSFRTGGYPWRAEVGSRQISGSWASRDEAVTAILKYHDLA